MRIGIDYTPAYEQTAGIGRLVRELITHLAPLDTHNDYRLFVAGATLNQLPPRLGGNFRWYPTRITPRWLVRLRYRLQIPVPVQVFTGPVDLYHATDFVLPPILGRIPTLLTVHDLSFVRVPETASPALKRYLDTVVPQSVKRATHVLADSAATRQDLIDLYDTPPDKVTVLLSGVDSRFNPMTITDQDTVRAKYNIPSAPFIFTIGTVQPRKNYGRLIESLAKLRAEGVDVHLVIAGGRGWLADPIYATLDKTGMRPFVHFIGFADDCDLPALYSAADCVAYPSLYEGFGFPVLEGMACGTPVVTSDVSSLPEVAGDAALMVDPYDVDAITAALRRILQDDSLRATLTERGFEQVRSFTWDRAASQLFEIYQRMLPAT